MSSSNKQQTEYTVHDFLAAEAELQELKEKNNMVEEKTSWWKKLGDKYVAYKEGIKPVTISKKKYMLTALLLGWLGVHQFMVGKKLSGILYALVCWTGISFVLSVMDLFYAAFYKTDENGCILI